MFRCKTARTFIQHKYANCLTNNRAQGLLLLIGKYFRIKVVLQLYYSLKLNYYYIPF